MTVAAKLSLAESAYRQVKSDILACRLAPGTIITAYQLAPALGMSRTPVNDALKALCQDGLLQVIPRVGYLVTTLSVADIHEIYQLRLTLETLAAGLAAEHYTPAYRTQFEGWEQRSMELLKTYPVGHIRRPEVLIEANREFHVLVASISGNTRLAHSIAALIDESQRVYFLQFLPHGDVGDPHGEVFAAIEARDVEAARDAMARHVRDTQQLTLQAMAELRT